MILRKTTHISPFLYIVVTGVFKFEMIYLIPLFEPCSHWHVAIISFHTPSKYETLVKCWANVVDGGPKEKQRWAKASCLLGITHKIDNVTKYMSILCSDLIILLCR